MEWKTIDSAPKNGDYILCFDGDKKIICYWSDYEDDGSSWCTHLFGRQKGWNDWQNEIHHPTHWTELPEDPKE